MSLQFVNIKIIFFGITAMSSYILRYYRSLPAVTGFILMLVASGFIGRCCGAAFGAALNASLSQRAVRQFLTAYYFLFKIISKVDKTISLC